MKKILVAALMAFAVSTQAEMFHDRPGHGDMHRYYDTTTQTLCYRIYANQGISCTTDRRTEMIVEEMKANIAKGDD